MKYTDSHEWIEMETTDLARVGITEFAQKELGDIVYIELPILGKTIQAKQEIAVLESTKAAADLYSPISGTVFEINNQLKNSPELVNQSPEKDGWIYKIRMSDSTELDLLMNHSEYQAMVNGA